MTPDAAIVRDGAVAAGRGIQDALRVVVPRMAMAGFDLQSDVAPRRLDFRAPGGLRVGVLLHQAADGGTILAAFGEAPRKVPKAFATLQD